MIDPQRRRVLQTLGIGTAALVGGVGTVSAQDEGDEEAGIRVAHASPNAPPVDVYVNGALVIEALEFRSVTDYLEVPPGEYDIAVNPAGTNTTVFSAENLPLEAEDYTAVARGEVGEETDTEFTVDILEDTNGANIGDDEARVRAIHASPDAPAVDVVAVADGLETTLFEGVEFGESSGYVVVPSGDYTVEIRPADGGPAVFTTKEPVTLEGGSTNTAFAVGYLTPDEEPADEAFGLVPVQDKSAPPRGDGEGRGPPGR